ncbi:UNVERIFIED_CONTAM: hypothetical protein RMT77_009734 [Armadillidium vulgare]
MPSAEIVKSIFMNDKKKRYYTSEGFVIETVSGEWARKLKKNYFLLNEAVRVTPGNYILPSNYKNWHARYQSFNVKPTDVFVVSFPKSGTTWTQEMVWCLLHNLDYEKAKVVLTKRFPYFEYEGMIPSKYLFLMPNLEKGDPNIVGESWKILNSLPSPRTIKTHLFKELLPVGIWSTKPKIVYVCRDPRDVCVSFFYHAMRYNGFRGDFSDFVEHFLNDMLIMFTPYWKHVLDYWALRNEENILFIRYEELQQDISGMIQKVSAFLGKEITKDEVENLANHLSFESMKNNKAVNNDNLIVFPLSKAKRVKFMRKGKVGDWRTHMTREQILAFKEWTEKNLANSDFPYYRDYDAWLN